MILLENLEKDFGLELFGSKERKICGVGTPEQHTKNTISWAKNANTLTKFKEGLVICNSEDFRTISPSSNVTYLYSSQSPRLIFAKILTKYFSRSMIDDFENHVETFKKDKNITIGNNVFIGNNVSIGIGTIIHHNAVIYSNTTIGNNCIISTNSSIGTEGLGLEFDNEKNQYIKFPQIGGVIIEDNVELGPNSTIRRAAINNTIIQRGTKIGSMCNVGHNCVIGENCILTSNVIISGSSVIGNNVFMGVSSIIRNRINIGNSVTIGQGAVVISDIPNYETWVGNPAKKL